MSSRKKRATIAGKPAIRKKTAARRQTSRQTTAVKFPARGVSNSASPMTVDELDYGHQRDASDVDRDGRQRSDLMDETARSPLDRHRERLTAVEPEEDNVRDDDDDPDTVEELRSQAIAEQDATNNDERALGGR